MRHGMSRKAGNFTRDCYNLQRYRDTLRNDRRGSLSEDSGTTNTTSSEITSTDTEGGNDIIPVVQAGLIDERIKKKQQETLDKNKLVALELVKRAASEKGLECLWAFYEGRKDNNGTIAVKNEEDRDLYYMFIDTCVVNMISRKDWKNDHNCKNLSKYITVSDEAFAMLVLENIATTLLEQEGMLGEQGVAGGVVPVMMKGMPQTTKYTRGVKDAESGKMRGWRKKGIERYNMLCQDVIVRRAIVEISDQLEIDLKKRYQREEREEEKVEDALEVGMQGRRTEKKKRKYVQGYDMSMQKMPKLEQKDLVIPEDYSQFEFDLSKSVAL